MNRFMSWINIAAGALALFVNLGANVLPLNGKTTASISDQFPVLFVPAGYVFAIWSVIYIGWIAFLTFQALPSQRTNTRLQRIGWLFVLASLANAAWLFSWHYELFPLSVVLMLSLLALLITIYWRMDIGRTPVSTAERLMVDVPFGLYLGWISVATIANVSDLLYYWNWDGFGFGAEVWAVTMLVIASGIALVMALTRAEVAFGLVLVWAFVGIAVKQAAFPTVANAAFIMAGFVLLTIPLGLWYRHNKALVTKFA